MTNWEKRERRYTFKYSRQIKVVLNQQWQRAIAEYKKTGEVLIPEDAMTTAYKRIYRQIANQEAAIAIKSITQTKDLFSSIAGLFTGELTIRVIRTLLLEYFEIYVSKRLKMVNGNTRQQILEVIDLGISENKTLEQIAQDLINKAKIVNPQRAIRIARTESVTAANRTQLLAYEASPYEYEKAWIRIADDKTREPHLAMDPNNYIDLFDVFTVFNRRGIADQMIAPGDTEATAENVINCRCILKFKPKRDSNGRLIRKTSI